MSDLVEKVADLFGSIRLDYNRKQARAAIAVVLEEAARVQPSTAADPNENAYQRGRFDGIIEYASAIRALATPAVDGEGE